MKNKRLELVLVLGIILLFIFSAVTPMVVGFNVGTAVMDQDKNIEPDIVFYNFDKYYFPETYLPEKRVLGAHADDVKSEESADPKETAELSLIETEEEPLQTATSSGLMDSPWPMHNYDVRHTGRSPYSTADNPGVEIWNFKDETYYMKGSVVIDKNGTIYCSSLAFYAIHPNGTMKWKYDNWGGYPWAAPAIDENGTIYIGLMYNVGDSKDFYAFYPDGTVKWIFKVGHNVHSSPAISDDGMIYFGSENSNLYALYPNGTIRWKYKTNHIVFSSPAIGQDGTIYFGSIDRNVYAVYSSNGTLKWKFNTGSWVHGSAAVGDDGTVYIGSDSEYLYALYPNNGTLKWKYKMGGAIWSTPVIDEDGIIYVGDSSGYFHAIYPNGTRKWKFDTGGGFWFGASAAISADGTIYFGTTSFMGGTSNFFALNADGTEKWRYSPGWYESSPAIGEDGTVYVASSHGDFGYLRAFGRGPLLPDANGPYSGYVNQTVQFSGTHLGGIPPYTYRWDFGDETNSTEKNPTHIYTKVGEYIAMFTVTDSEGNFSSDNATVRISYPPPTVIITKPARAFYINNRRIIPLLFNTLIIGGIDIEVDASQEHFGIDRVEFNIDGDLEYTDTSEPYSWRWDKRMFFRHTIKVVAVDNSGNSTKDEIMVWKFF